MGRSLTRPADTREDKLQKASTAGHMAEPTSTGLNNRKLLMWAFLGSECMFFGSLITAYLLYRGRNVVGPYPDEILNIPFTSVSTFVLLTSSLAMVLALSAIQRGNLRWSKVWLLATALLGVVFLLGQVYEFNHFVNEGLTPRTNLFGASFFTLTGFHGAHVTVGVIWLLSLFVVAWRGKLKKEQALNVELAGLYWHFVDIVWIVIFTVVYLIGAAPTGG